MYSNWSYSPETPNSAQYQRFFVPCNLEIWQMTMNNNMGPLLTYVKLCASFRSHWWIETGVTVRKRPIWVKIGDFLSPVTLKFDRRPSHAPLLCYFKLCTSFRSHLWIQTGVIIRKKPKLGQNLPWPLWPWPLTCGLALAWTSLLSMVISFENFLTIQWQKHSQNVWQTDGRTDGWTDGKDHS